MFVDVVIDRNCIEELPIDSIVLNQIANVEVDDVKVENIEELTNVLNKDPNIDGIPDNLPLNLEIDQLCKDIQHQHNRRCK